MVENRAGAGGFTGSNAGRKAAPDGYTFLEMPNSIASFSLIMKVKLDPLTDLTPVALLARSPTAMVVNASLPVKTVEGVHRLRQGPPDQVFYGHAGIGTTQQQHAEMFKRATGLKMKNVNYKSSAEAQTDLVAGRLQLMFVTVASTLGQIQGGQLRLLAYTDKNYPPGGPTAPTMAEAGVPGMEKAQSWWGIFAPPRLPAEHPRPDERRDQRGDPRAGVRRAAGEVRRDAAPVTPGRIHRGGAAGDRRGRGLHQDGGRAVAPGGVSVGASLVRPIPAADEMINSWARLGTSMRLVAALVCLCAGLGAVLGGVMPAHAATRQVVVLFDERPELPGLAALDAEFVRTLNAGSADRIEIYREELDRSRFDVTYVALQRDFLRAKYANKKIDAVVAVIGPALDFLLDHGSEIFPGIPIVFCGLDRAELADRRLPAHVGGVLVKREFAPTLEIALRLHPRTRQVFVVAGTSEFDTRLLEQAKKEFLPYESRPFLQVPDLVAAAAAADRARSRAAGKHRAVHHLFPRRRRSAFRAARGGPAGIRKVARAALRLHRSVPRPRPRRREPVQLLRTGHGSRKTRPAIAVQRRTFETAAGGAVHQQAHIRLAADAALGRA